MVYILPFHVMMTRRTQATKMCQYLCYYHIGMTVIELEMPVGPLFCDKSGIPHGIVSLRIPKINIFSGNYVMANYARHERECLVSCRRETAVNDIEYFWIDQCSLIEIITFGTFAGHLDGKTQAPQQPLPPVQIFIDFGWFFVCCIHMRIEIGK